MLLTFLMIIQIVLMIIFSICDKCNDNFSWLMPIVGFGIELVGNE